MVLFAIAKFTIDDREKQLTLRAEIEAETTRAIYQDAE
jgi:hypothetical protein